MAAAAEAGVPAGGPPCKIALRIEKGSGYLTHEQYVKVRRTLEAPAERQAFLAAPAGRHPPVVECAPGSSLCVTDLIEQHMVVAGQSQLKRGSALFVAEGPDIPRRQACAAAQRQMERRQLGRRSQRRAKAACGRRLPLIMKQNGSWERKTTATGAVMRFSGVRVRFYEAPAEATAVAVTSVCRFKSSKGTEHKGEAVLELSGPVQLLGALGLERGTLLCIEGLHAKLDGLAMVVRNTDPDAAKVVVRGHAALSDADLAAISAVLDRQAAGGGAAAGTTRAMVRAAYVPNPTLHLIHVRLRGRTEGQGSAAARDQGEQTAGDGGSGGSGGGAAEDDDLLLPHLPDSEAAQHAWGSLEDPAWGQYSQEFQSWGEEPLPLGARRQRRRQAAEQQAAAQRQAAAMRQQAAAGQQQAGDAGATGSGSASGGSPAALAVGVAPEATAAAPTAAAAAAPAPGPHNLWADLSDAELAAWLEAELGEKLPLGKLLQELLRQAGRAGVASVFADAVADQQDLGQRGDAGSGGGGGGHDGSGSRGGARDKAGPLQQRSTRFLLQARQRLAAARQRSRGLTAAIEASQLPGQASTAAQAAAHGGTQSLAEPPDADADDTARQLASLRM